MPSTSYLASAKEEIVYGVMVEIEHGTILALAVVRAELNLLPIKKPNFVVVPLKIAEAWLAIAVSLLSASGSGLLLMNFSFVESVFLA